MGKVWCRGEPHLPERGTGRELWLNASLVPGAEPSQLPTEPGAPMPIYKWGKRLRVGNLSKRAHGEKPWGQESDPALFWVYSQEKPALHPRRGRG